MKRNLSLDVMRGMTILGMILVNNPGPGGTLNFLQHNTWDGCTVADLVFPFFLFIVGASIFFAMGKSKFRLDAGVTMKIIRRSLLLFAVGYLLNALWFDRGVADIRIMAALQRIALVYLLAAFLVLGLKKIWKIVLLTFTLLLGFWALIHYTDSYLPQNNVLAQFDMMVLGANRMYTIAGAVFDPEGIVGTISALCNALIGYVFAYVMTKRGFLPSLILGAVLAVGGYFWADYFPLNKPLWSSSFVLWTCGLAGVLWTLLYYVVDLCGATRWAKIFTVFGTNAIFAYVLSQVLASLNWSFDFCLSRWLFDNVYGGFLPSWAAALTWSFIVVGVTWGVTYMLYRRKIFIKL